MHFRDKTTLGRTGLSVGRLGISSSYSAPAEAYEEAFEKGCNYFHMGSFIKGRSKEMIKAIRHITEKGKRDELAVAMYDYTHSPLIGQKHFMKGLRKMGLEYVDELMLGYYSSLPRRSIINWAIRLKEKGLARHIGVSRHNRKVFAELLKDGIVDVYHVRYNAVNSGAEQDVFPLLPAENKPGIAAYTATRWGQLLKEKKMPPGEKPLTAPECYRFVLSHPSVDLCMTGARNLAMMRENLETLEQGPLTGDEMDRIRRIGDFMYGRKRSQEQPKENK
jgi:aryl-alcohol dehydrogenase-like predicted oxidoreductase